MHTDAGGQSQVLSLGMLFTSFEKDSHWSWAQQIISTGCPLSLEDSPLHLLSAAREFYVHCEDSPGILYPL